MIWPVRSWIVLRHQHFVEAHPHQFGVGARGEQKLVDAADEVAIVRDGDGARAEARPRLVERGGLACRAVREWAGLLHEIERAMSGLVGELQHVREALARVRHFLLGEPREPRILAEAFQRVLQVAREVLQLREQVRLALICHVRGMVTEEGGFAHLEVLLSAGVSAPPQAGMAPRILSIFSLSVTAVNGLIT